MLVLSRKKNESIIISDDIIVTVIEIRGDKVRLGIEAPKDISVHRREVYEAIHGTDPTQMPNRDRDRDRERDTGPSNSPVSPDPGLARNSNG